MDHRTYRKQQFLATIILTVMIALLFGIILGQRTLLKEDKIILTGLNPEMTKGLVEFRLLSNRIISEREGERVVAVGVHNYYNSTGKSRIEIYLPPEVAEVVCHEIYHNMWYGLPDEEKEMYEELNKQLREYSAAEAHSMVNQKSLKDCFSS